LRPILLDIVGDRRDMSATSIANELNNRRVPTVTKGSRWHAMQVICIMDRLRHGFTVRLDRLTRA
jgi:hypothetical protein